MSTCQECNKRTETDEYSLYAGIHNNGDLYNTFTLCEDCAESMGFCRGCGWMMAGSEADENSGLKGYCHACAEGFREELGEYDHDNDIEVY